AKLEEHRRRFAVQASHFPKGLNRPAVIAVGHRLLRLAVQLRFGLPAGEEQRQEGKDEFGSHRKSPVCPLIIHRSRAAFIFVMPNKMLDPLAGLLAGGCGREGWRKWAEKGLDKRSRFVNAPAISCLAYL